MSEYMIIFNALKEVPETAKKPIHGGRLKGMTDINPMWRMEKMTETFGPIGFGWYFEVIKKEMVHQPITNETAAFVDINLYVKYKDEWSKPIFGTGGSAFVEQENRGPHMSDECFKMALTDAISVACKSLGLGADVYRGLNDGKYSTKKDEPSIDISTMNIKEIAQMKVGFGKYKDLTLKELYKQDHSYFIWAMDNSKDQSIKDACKMLEDAATKEV